VKPYTEIPGFGEIVLEESYVLGICATPASLRIEGEFVLTPSHPGYSPPPADENECYVRGQIVFAGVRRLVWEEQGAAPATDASGEADYGHIDDLRWDGQLFELAGDWGRIDVTAAGVRLDLFPEPDGAT
jgi:hypothetical protein